MFGLPSKIATQLASYASIMGLYLTAFPLGGTRPQWHWYLLATITVLFVYMAIREIWEAMHQSYRTFMTKGSIDRYMRKLIAKEGRTVIFSRDLSWGAEERAKEVLLSKSKAGNLTIYVHHEMPLSDELKAAGAEVVVYGQKGLEPRSRFTIIGYGKEGSRVAVGTKRKGRQVVYEFDTGEHPVCALAEDLIRHLRQENVQ
jgi:hypothetical protein